MAGADAAIQAALYGHLKALVLPTALPLAPEGRNFDGKGKAYLRPTYMPGEASAPHIPFDGDSERVGLYQIDVFWPVNQGVTDALKVADVIRAHFARGLRLPMNGIELRVLGEPYALPSMQESALLQVPVRIPWWVCAYTDA